MNLMKIEWELGPGIHHQTLLNQNMHMEQLYESTFNWWNRKSSNELNKRVKLIIINRVEINCVQNYVVFF